jgi:flagellar motor component MotA
MENQKIKEFKDDAAADTSVASVGSSLTKLASATTNIKDYARVIEALMKWLKAKKGSQLSSLDSNQNYKMVLNYLNKMQSDVVDTKKQSQQPIAQK